MKRLRGRRVGSAAGILLLLVFWLAPRFHLLEASATETGHGVCPGIPCAFGLEAFPSREDAGADTHDPDECPLCRLAALPYVLPLTVPQTVFGPFGFPARSAPPRAMLVFTYLVVAPAAALVLSRRLRRVVWISIALAVCCTLAGLYGALAWDLPANQLIVALLAAALVLAASVSGFRKRTGAGIGT